MKHRLFILFVAALATTAGVVVAADDANWPQWRGPTGNGVSPGGDPPVSWSESENIRFKVEIPGHGLASPIVWKDRVFILTAVPVDEEAFEASQQETGQPGARNPRDRQGPPPGVKPVEVKFVVLALSRSDGRLLWERTATEGTPGEGHHLHASWASASPVTDGKRLIAHFGSNGTFAYDLSGKLLWKTDLGEMTTRRGFGEGSSPVLHGDTVVINWDHEGDSFIVALDAGTGKELWKKKRSGEPTSWSTPLVVSREERDLVVVAATGKSRAYDLETGDVVWSIGGMTTNTIPSPVHRDGVVYLMSGFRGNALQAISLDGATGNLEGTGALAWTYDRNTPYVPSPLLYDDSLYFLKHLKSILSCLDADSGEVRFTEQRLPGMHNVYASPVGASGRVYIFDRDGHAVVLKHGKGFEVLAENTIDDGVDASPAIVGDEIFVRGHDHLYCIAKRGGK
jgi:outer membrane protein assembly factor BamB